MKHMTRDEAVTELARISGLEKETLASAKVDKGKPAMQEEVQEAEDEAELERIAEIGPK